MNDLCADIGYQSLNKHGEQLCGDHVEVVHPDEHSSILVLADGLGSGVKASILSTLTAKIISTMMGSGLEVEDFLHTIAKTLPVCSVRKVAYSTFTIIQIVDNKKARIIQYDNPHVIFFRDNHPVELDTVATVMDGKTIYQSEIDLEEGDLFVALSDGAVHAGIGNKLNFGWQRSDIIKYLETLCFQGFTASTLSAMVADECNDLYQGMPGDDTTVCAVCIRKREPLQIVVGPPAHPADDERMMSLFFSKEGKRVVCGGTTSGIVSQYLDRPVVPSLLYTDPDIPPTATIEGIDLVTEGVITLSRVLDYAKDYLHENKLYNLWGYQKDGASTLARMLFEDATDIHFFVGKAMNPAHQNPDLPINFHIKMQLVNQLVECLEQMGKTVTVSSF